MGAVLECLDVVKDIGARQLLGLVDALFDTLLFYAAEA